jgi:hypothetical protein
VKRIVQPELLDSLPENDPRAVRSRRDLRRVNAWMGNAAILTRALQSRLSAAPKRITELGAGDGHLLLRLAQKTAPGWTGVNATLLDRQKIVSAGTLAALSELGWRAEVAVEDVLTWPPPPDPERVFIANLFLHHFEEAELAGLLQKISRHGNLFVAVEPHRFAQPELVGQLLRLIGCNAVTRYDAVTSIGAGFKGGEISALWPDQANWRLTERRAGLFSHLFIAQKTN